MELFLCTQPPPQLLPSPVSLPFTLLCSHQHEPPLTPTPHVFSLCAPPTLLFPDPFTGAQLLLPSLRSPFWLLKKVTHLCPHPLLKQYLQHTFQTSAIWLLGRAKSYLEKEVVIIPSSKPENLRPSSPSPPPSSQRPPVSTNDILQSIDEVRTLAGCPLDG